MKVVIAQCTNKKRNVSGKVPAKDLYMASDLFRAQWKYAQAVGDICYILSAKYGLLRPYDRISTYDVSITNPNWNGFRETTQEHITATIKNHSDKEFELICGEAYAEVLEPYLEMFDCEYSKPFEGQRIGVRKKNMIREAEREMSSSITDYAP